MPPARATVRVSLCCAHPGCSEHALVGAERSDESGGMFHIVPPPGWSDLGEHQATTGAPYEVRALCSSHAPDPHVLFLRSLAEVAACVRATPGRRGSALRARVERCARAIEMWKAVAPTDTQLEAMHVLIAELRSDAGLPPGVRRATREPKR